MYRAAARRVCRCHGMDRDEAQQPPPTCRLPHRAIATGVGWLRSFRFSTPPARAPGASTLDPKQNPAAAPILASSAGRREPASAPWRGGCSICRRPRPRAALTRVRAPRLVVVTASLSELRWRLRNSARATADRLGLPPDRRRATQFRPLRLRQPLQLDALGDALGGFGLLFVVLRPLVDGGEELREVGSGLLAFRTEVRPVEDAPEPQHGLQNVVMVDAEVINPGLGDEDRVLLKVGHPDAGHGETDGLVADRVHGG